MVDKGIIGQALYTWGPERLGAMGQGYGFVDISPGWESELPWLDANAKSLTGFMGRSQATEEERARYRPLGRHVNAGTAIAYGKYYIGMDGFDRLGNYAVHFFMAEVKHISMTDVLMSRDELWVTGNGVYSPSWKKLDDLKPAEFRVKLNRAPDLTWVKPDRVRSAIAELVSTGSVSVSKWNTADIMGLIGTLPFWADYAMSLVPEWTDSGSALVVELPRDAAVDQVYEDRRPALTGELLELKLKLNRASCTAELESIFWPHPRDIARPSGSAQKHLEDCIIRWAAQGTKNMVPDELTTLSEDPPSTLENLAKQNRKIPSSRKPDQFTLELLNRCDGAVDRQLMSKVLPAEDEITGIYAGLSTNTTVLEAAIWLNAGAAREISIVLRRSILEATINLLIDTSKEDEQFMEGLVHSVKISSRGEGSFARQLFLADTADWDHLYSKVLPAAADGRASLLSLASVNSERFFTWMKAPEPYAAALTDMLRHDTHEAMWERISALLGRWRKR
jgi:hypothetical protein